jgi:tRNA threonylcarbamoyladenosine biosynthesis protein TsaE
MTQAIAEALAPSLEPGDVLALVGELGTGKTCFTQGLARSLGVPNPRVVNSPTFVLLNVYHGRFRVYHFDAYRLSGADAWLDLGVDDLLYGDGVCLIEWADRVQDALPPDRLEVRFTHAGPSERELTFIPTGSRAGQILDGAGAALRAAAGSDK